MANVRRNLSIGSKTNHLTILRPQIVAQVLKKTHRTTSEPQGFGRFLVLDVLFVGSIELALFCLEQSNST